MLLTLALLGCNPVAEPTWHADVAPLIVEHCGGCHTDGAIAPFALDSYEDFSLVSALAMDAIESGRMPPWYAEDTDECTVERPWKKDQRFTEEELELLRTWMASGAPEGDAADATPAEIIPLSIVDPDAVLPFQAPFTVEAEGGDQFQCFVLDPGNEETVWVTQVQLNPGNAEVDHHALIIADLDGGTAGLANVDGNFPCFTFPDELTSGYLMATWTPGAVPMSPPESTGMYLPAGARILVQMHYHPGDGPQTDQSAVALKWTTETPEWAALQALVGNNSRQEDDGTGLQPGPNDPESGPAFIIPAGETAHTETLLYTQNFDLEFPIYSVATHMHYVGTDMKIDLVPASSDPECLLQTEWDFNWQRAYDYDTPIDELPVIGKGDSLLMRCTYNNTTSNPGVKQALDEQGLTEPGDVVLGDETLDEMCLGLFGILVPPSLMGTVF